MGKIIRLRHNRIDYYESDRRILRPRYVIKTVGSKQLYQRLQFRL